MNAAEDDVSDKGPYYFSQIRVDPNDPDRIFVTGVSLGNSYDGGRTWADITWPPRRMFAGIFGDVRTPSVASCRIRCYGLASAGSSVNAFAKRGRTIRPAR
jgi:hypothetical protein